MHTETDVLVLCLSLLKIDHCSFPFQIVDELYGIDFNGPHPAEEYDGPSPSNETSSVEVPQTEMPITQEAYQHLRRTINPLRDSEFYGVDIYAEVLQIFS